ncbi:MAG: hypothetical protein QNJ97_06525 [Myxococcota bacterium]|nr:hypothetical protein [Myxococcota bacterium]
METTGTTTYSRLTDATTTTGLSKITAQQTAKAPRFAPSAPTSAPKILRVNGPRSTPQPSRAVGSLPLAAPQQRPQTEFQQHLQSPAKNELQYAYEENIVQRRMVMAQKTSDGTISAEAVVAEVIRKSESPDAAAAARLEPIEKSQSLPALETAPTDTEALANQPVLSATEVASRPKISVLSTAHLAARVASSYGQLPELTPSEGEEAERISFIF